MPEGMPTWRRAPSATRDQRRKARGGRSGPAGTKAVKDAVDEIRIERKPPGKDVGADPTGGAAAPTQQVAQALQEPDANAPEESVPADGA